MQATGANIKVKPEPKDRVLDSGIIIPETSKMIGFTWAKVEQANDYVIGSKGEKLKVGSRVLLIGQPKEVIPNRQILYWED